MKKINIFYRIRLVEDLFFVYKFSYRGPTIKIVESGKAFNSKGDETKQFKTVLLKYGITANHIKSGSYSDLIATVYFQIRFPSQPFLINDNLFKLIKELHIRFSDEENKEEARSKFLKIADGVLINQNDFFAVNDSHQVLIDSADFDWVIDIYDKFGWDGINACCAYLEDRDPLKNYITERYTQALSEIKELSSRQ